MKSHIIQLDQHDNVLSISDKLSWGKTKRILLVYPSSGRLILSKIDLILVLRAAKKLGLSVGLVAIPHALKNLAIELEIPFFRTINDAQRYKWYKKEKKSDHFQPRLFKEIRKVFLDYASQESGWKLTTGVRILFFSLGVMAVLLIALLFIPSAEIHLNQIEKQQTISLHINANNNVKEVILTGSIPSQIIIVEVEGTKQSQIRTQVEVPDKIASGMVRFTNLTSENVYIPAGTIVSQLDEPGFRFITTESGEILPDVSETIDLPVQALTSGKIGNLEQNTIGTVIGDLGIKLIVTNPTPTTGGTDLITTMPTEIDRKNLYTSLEAELRAQALQKSRSNLEQGDIIFADSISINKIIEEVYIPGANQPGDQLSLKLKLFYSISFAGNSDLLKLAIPRLKLNLPQDFHGVDDSITVKILGNPKTNIDGTTNFEINVSQKINRKMDINYLSRLLTGRTEKEAYGLLQKKYNSEMDPTIEIKPSWWSHLPVIPLRIVILN